MRLRHAVVVAALAFSQAAHAVAMIELMKMDAVGQSAAVKPIMLAFLQRGYKKVPNNEFTLIGEMEKLAYEKGYTYQNIEQVAEEAALRLGMYR